MRQRFTNKRYSPSLDYLLLTDGSQLSCFDKAMQVDSKFKWIEEMDEVYSLHINQSWGLVKLPEGDKTIQNNVCTG